MATGSRAKVYVDVNVHEPRPPPPPGKPREYSQAAGVLTSRSTPAAAGKPREYWDNVDVNVQKTSFRFSDV